MGTLGEAPEILANDLTRLMGTSADYAPYHAIREFFPSEAVPYPPFAFFLSAMLSKLGILGGAATFYLVFVFGSFLLAWYAFRDLPVWQRAIGCLAFTIGSYPFLYALDRANFDALAFLLTGGALLIERADRRKEAFWLAPSLIGIAAALKIYPIFFALIYLTRRGWKEIAVSCFVMVSITLFASHFLAGNLTEQAIHFLNEMKLTNICYERFDSCQNLSFLYPIKQAIHFIFGEQTENVLAIKIAYTIASIGLFSLVIALIYFRHTNLPVAVTLITILGIWVPVMSFDYKLLFVIFPVFLLIDERKPSLSMIGGILLFTLVSKRGLGHSFETDINQTILLLGFVLTALTLFDRPAIFLNSLGTRVTKVFPILLLISFTLPYLFLTARAFHVPTGGEIHLPMSDQTQDSFFGAGWGPFEKDANNSWRWIHGCEAALNLRVTAGHDYTLRIYAGNHARNEGQMVNVLFNKASLGTHSLGPAENRELVFNLPATDIPRTQLVPDKLLLRTLVCNPPDEKTPTRLGVAVSQITLSPRD